MEGKINVFGDADVMFAVYKDGTYADTIPGKNDGFSFQKAECTNGATAKWDYSEWGVKVTSLNKTKTKCSLYFVTGSVTGEQSGESKMEELLDKGGISTGTLGMIIKDDFDNIRYIGPNPNNYVKFNNEMWRIIGLMVGIKTKSNGTQRLLKIIRNDSLGDYSWDSSASNINSGWGVNEWSQADIQKVLNANYLNRTAGGTCYGGSKESIKACPDWTTVGLNPTAQNMVEEVTWNTGTANGTESVWQKQNFTPQQYMWERSTNHEKQCLNDKTYNGIYCNDSVERTTEWLGKVGLMYPSDFGYATDGGGDLMKRGQCLYTPLDNWDDTGSWNDLIYSYCGNNDWLLYSGYNQWTITPAPYSSKAANVFHVSGRGGLGINTAQYIGSVRPVVYLKSSVKIIGGDGTSGNPYTLTIS